MNKTVLRLAAACAMLMANLAHAQYVWIDEKGVRQFSDRPPPASTPANKILKAPGRSTPNPAQEAPAAVPEASPAKPASNAPTLAQREMEFRKRAQEREKEERKAAQEAEMRKAQAENCKSARNYKALLDSGIRVAKMGDDGQRAFITDEERAQRAARANKVLDGCR